MIEKSIGVRADCTTVGRGRPPALTRLARRSHQTRATSAPATLSRIAREGTSFRSIRMCGIVGYVGNNYAYPVLIGGLQRLEYRGYDSAGIATLVANGAMHIRRAKGKLENLRAMVGQSPLGGHIGIGHTRWATHGKPSEENAHPHKAGPVAVIHNGIVENFIELRAALVARRHKLKSETDTELISHLIEEKLRAGRG